MKRHGSTVQMLCGLTGSGKTTAARELVERGCERLSVDQVIFDRFGRQDEDFRSGEYLAYHDQIIAELDDRLGVLITRGRDVVLDYGREFWTRTSRDRYKRFIEEHGGRWNLLYLQADRRVLLDRLRERNRRSDADAFHVTRARLDAFIAQFEEPRGEGEVVRVQQPDDVVKRATDTSSWQKRAW